MDIAIRPMTLQDSDEFTTVMSVAFGETFEPFSSGWRVAGPVLAFAVNDGGAIFFCAGFVGGTGGIAPVLG